MTNLDGPKTAQIAQTDRPQTGVPTDFGEVAFDGSESAWLNEMKRAYRDLDALGRRLRLPLDWVRQIAAPSDTFPLFVPHPFVRRMRIGDLNDPLLRQILPRREESQHVPGFSRDPVMDQAAQVIDGVISKYPGRVLLIAAGECAVHCRYCFRRHFPYSSAPRSAAGWQPALDQLAVDGSLRELILSGGDPLTLRDDVLDQLIERIELTLPQLKRLRIHTRLPVVIPTRVTDAFVARLESTRFDVIVVVHLNHAQEMDESVTQALRRLRSTGALLLNQAVLLRGVNDDVDALSDLSDVLIGSGVIPYYLNQLDRVAGGAHFEVSEATGRRLMGQLQSRLPGYAVPRYVRDVAGGSSKRSLMNR